MDEPKKDDTPAMPEAVDQELETLYPDPISTTPEVETKQPVSETSTEEVSSTPKPTFDEMRSRNMSFEIASQLSDSKHTARRFLAAYLTSALAALSLLGSAAFLGYVLLEHFIAPKKDEGLWYYFDFAPVYLATMTSMLVFGALYFVASQYVARQAARDEIGVKDWRVYKVVYAAFSAVLLVAAASVLASLLYIPLAQVLITEDLTSHQIAIQTLGGLHVLVWIGLLIWQERLVKNGTHTWLQGTVVTVLAVALVVLTGIFPVGGKTDDRYDKRVSADLSTLETAIDNYRTDNNERLPETLDDLDLEDDPTVEARVDEYTYTPKQTAESEDTAAMYSQEDLLKMQELDTADPTGASSDAYINSISVGAQVQDTSTYQICATFRTDTSSQDDPMTSLLGSLASETGVGNTDAFTKHAKGEVCFDRS